MRNETKIKEPSKLYRADSRFELGSIYATPGALEVLAPFEVFGVLQRHLAGDWGECCEEDALANEEALISGGRLISNHRSISGEKIWLITEADRSATTVLLPREY